jgi:hypothetical protein
MTKGRLAMPLRDHFRPPLDNTHSWDEVHGGWPMVIVQSLARKLPNRYVAAPQVHLGTLAQIDVSSYEYEDASGDKWAGKGNGSVATEIWAPARPTLTLTTDLPAQDEYEVRIYDTKHGRRLVAAVELVSPANKDRPEHRAAFVAKCAALLQNKVSVTIVDLVTIRNDNLYAELLDLIGQGDPALGNEPPGIYAVACRATKADPKPGATWQLETWFNQLQIGQPLPRLPLWLAPNLSVPLELEETYEETCKALRIL